MALATNLASNLSLGKGIVYFKRTGETSFLDLGEVPKLEFTPTRTKEPFYSSRSGVKQKAYELTTEQSMTGALDFVEYSAQNMDIAFNGEGLEDGTQTVGSLDGVEVTPVSDGFVDLGKTNLFSTKINHGTVTEGPFVAGDTVVAASAATGTIGWVDDAEGFIEVFDITGAFTVGATMTCGGTDAPSAVVTAVTLQSDIIAVDDATTPTVRYELGTDYNLDAIGGMFRKLSTGSIGATVDISGDYKATVEQTINVLAGDDVEGQLLFIGTSDQGPRYRVDLWKCILTASSAIGLISDAITPITLNIEVLSDAINHPNSPFGRVTQIQAA